MEHFRPAAAHAACVLLLLLSTLYRPAECVQTAKFDVCCDVKPLQYTPTGAVCTIATSGSVIVDLRNTRPGLRAINRLRRACRSSGGKPVDGICKAAPAGSTCGDPHVLGFDGSDYLLWGKPNTTYNLLSQRNHQVNIRLYHPPARADGHALFIDAVGLMFNGARVTVRLATTPAVDGEAAPPTSATLVVDVVHGDNEQQSIGWDGGKGAGERAVDEHTSYAFRNEHQVVITSDDVILSVVVMENDHLDVHLEEVVATWGDVHGVMGQSYAAAFKTRYSFAHGIKAVGALPDELAAAANGKKKLSLQGVEDDYITSGLLKADDKFSRFTGASAVAPATPVTRKLLTAGSTARFRVGGTVGALSAASAGRSFGRALLAAQACPATCDTSPVSPQLAALFSDESVL